MPKRAPVLPTAKLPAAKAGAYVLGICVAIGSLIAGYPGAWADGAAPQIVAHLDAILCLGGAAACLAMATGIPGICPPRSHRLALVTNSLTAGQAVAFFFTKAISGPAQRARRRAWRMKP